MQTEIAGGVRIIASGEVLETVAENILDNAASFAPDRSTIFVRLQVKQGAALLTVADEGPGVDSTRLDAIFERFEPNLVVGHVDAGETDLTEQLPFLRDRPARNGRATAYVCEHFACLPPVNEPEALLTQLTEGTGVAWRDF